MAAAGRDAAGPRMRSAGDGATFTTPLSPPAAPTRRRARPRSRAASPGTMPGSWLEALTNAAGAAVLAAAAAAQLWNAWRLATDANVPPGDGRGRPRRVVVRLPTGETTVVWATDAALAQMGLTQRRAWGGARPPMPAGGGEFGPDDYDALTALDADTPRRGGPVTRALVDHLPTHDFVPPRTPRDASVDTCAICLSGFEAGVTVRTLPCLHHYCRDCIDPWLLSRGRDDAECPCCKHKIFSGA